MKTVLACILLAVVAVNADGGRGGGPTGDRPGPIGGGGPGPVGGGPGPIGRGGPGPVGGGQGQWDSSESGERSYQCRCSRLSCRGVTGSKDIGCPNTNKYLECNNQTCSNQTCDLGQVWNRTKNACSVCDDGFQVAANLQVCVCKQSTTFDYKKRACVACPTDSVQEADRCYCDKSKAFDYKKNACRDCPAGSNVTRYQCRCNSTQFFNDNDWACQNCPGEWLPKPSSRRPFRLAPAAKCTCNGTNVIFDRETVTCYTCPAGTKASYDACVCTDRTQMFNLETKACECRMGFIANPAGSGCVRVSPSTTQSTPKMGSP